MPKLAKRTKAIGKKVVIGKTYPFDDGVALLVETKSAKFDETVDVAIRLGIDPKQSDQMVRGTVPLPHGSGKVVRVLVKTGDAVDAGQGIVVVEAMKMQNEIRAPRKGVVERLLVTEGQAVNSGDVLAIVA